MLTALRCSGPVRTGKPLHSRLGTRHDDGDLVVGNRTKGSGLQLCSSQETLK